MKILLVYNNKMRWADVFRAEEFKKHWTDEVDIVDRWHLPDGDNYDIIHFLYGGALTKSKDYILKHKEKVFTSSVSKRSLDGMWDDRKTLLELYNASRCCVCQNEEILSILKGLIPDVNAVYIPNGVNEKLFNRKFVAGFVGAKASNEHKGLHLAKQACEELGIELKEAHEWNYEHEDMPKFYSQIDCLLIPSVSEGSHNPTMEALAMNIPVISTDVGIAKELEGVTIVDRDVESIKKALRKLSGRIQILEKYKWSDIAKQYHDLYVDK
ncbi:MAG: glycosyltransferase family 4 protein [Candidatus Hodarchaeales archaeon]